MAVVVKHFMQFLVCSVGAVLCLHFGFVCCCSLLFFLLGVWYFGRDTVFLSMGYGPCYHLFGSRFGWVAMVTLLICFSWRFFWFVGCLAVLVSCG